MWLIWGISAGSSPDHRKTAGLRSLVVAGHEPALGGQAWVLEHPQHVRVAFFYHLPVLSVTRRTQVVAHRSLHTVMSAHTGCGRVYQVPPFLDEGVERVTARVEPPPRLQSIPLPASPPATRMRSDHVAVSFECTINVRWPGHRDIALSFPRGLGRKRRMDPPPANVRINLGHPWGEKMCQ